MNYREKKAFLKKQLASYEMANPMTRKERKEVREWVRLGNSPYTNPLSFITEHDMNDRDILAYLRAESDEEILEADLYGKEISELDVEDLPF